MSYFLKRFNFCLVFIIFILTGISVYRLFTRKYRMEYFLITDKEYLVNKKHRKDISVQEKLLSEYDFLKKRNLFQSNLPLEEDSISVSFKEEFTSDYKVAGVLLDKNPMAVIEGVKKKKVFFLSLGESIDGFKIIKVLEDKIILEKQNQRIEIGL